MSDWSTQDASTAAPQMFAPPPIPSEEESVVSSASSFLSEITFPMSPGDAEELMMASFRVAGVTGMSREKALDELKAILEWDYTMRAMVDGTT